ncbi:ribonuclease HI [Rhizobium sp. DKSPLA3]|uniref:ribonuclease H n=1 Tax=Rhizobium quercicola TaxID=2901226 RepID=A0A9X1NTK8_9HYPH|nr:RNase H family protein [Rhizobium quercicola]MCD7109459.1 ribonuclease HI [Rhizobium quercicola]
MEINLRDVFADGSFRPQSSRGGWAFVAYEDGQDIYRQHGCAAGGSNSRFELMAVVKAAHWIVTEGLVTPSTIWTDSRETVRGCQISRTIWRNNGWRRIEPNPKKRKRPIPDAALWQELDHLLLSNPFIRIDWCRGHDGVAGNELADTIARAAAIGAISPPAVREASVRDPLQG